MQYCGSGMHHDGENDFSGSRSFPIPETARSNETIRNQPSVFRSGSRYTFKQRIPQDIAKQMLKTTHHPYTTNAHPAS